MHTQYSNINPFSKENLKSIKINPFTPFVILSVSLGGFLLVSSSCGTAQASEYRQNQQWQYEHQGFQESPHNPKQYSTSGSPEDCIGSGWGADAVDRSCIKRFCDSFVNFRECGGAK